MTRLRFRSRCLELLKLGRSLAKLKAHVVELTDKVFTLGVHQIDHLFFGSLINLQMNDLGLELLYFLTQLAGFFARLLSYTRLLVMSRHVWLCLVIWLDMSRHVLICLVGVGDNLL